MGDAIFSKCVSDCVRPNATGYCAPQRAFSVSRNSFKKGFDFHLLAWPSYCFVVICKKLLLPLGFFFQFTSAPAISPSSHLFVPRTQNHGISPSHIALPGEFCFQSPFLQLLRACPQQCTTSKIILVSKTIPSILLLTRLRYRICFLC